MSEPSRWSFRLFALKGAATTDIALANFAELARRHLPQGYELEVIDLYDAPNLVGEHGIVAVPTLVRMHPEPVRRVIGDLSDVDAVLVALGIGQAR